MDRVPTAVISGWDVCQPGARDNGRTIAVRRLPRGQLLLLAAEHLWYQRSTRNAELFCACNFSRVSPVLRTERGLPTAQCVCRTRTGTARPWLAPVYLSNLERVLVNIGGRSVVILLACALLAASMTLEAAIAPSAGAVQPLKMGDHAPDFTAHRVDHTAYMFVSAHLAKPHVLIFYRGGWCPYCNRQLADLHLVEPKLRAAGFEVLFLSTDRPELLYSSLKNPDVPYTLLSDPTLEAAQAFHIAFHVDDETYAKELAWGVDLEKTTGTQAHALPVPTTVNASGATLAGNVTT